MTVAIRPIKEGDNTQIVEFFQSLSDQTMYRRFHGCTRTAWRALDYYSKDFYVLLAFDGEYLVGIGDLYIPEKTVSFVVADKWQKRGIASQLLEGFKAFARGHKITKLFGHLLLNNCGVVAFNLKHGFKYEKIEDGEALMSLEIEP